MSCTYQGHYDFPALYEGDTFVSREITIAEDVGTTLASARLVFEKGGTVTKTLTSSSGLTLVSTASGNWVIRINQWTLDLAVGTHIYDLETTDADGVVRHYVGGSLRVLDATA